MEFSLLANEPSAAPVVADWYFDQWCRDTGRYTRSEVLAKVCAATHTDKAPLMVLAKLDGELVGAAELKVREMELFPDFEFWLGGVYVSKKARGFGVASCLVTEIIQRARVIGITTLYLQTESLNGGLYSRHGFKPVQEVNYKGNQVLVMAANISG